MAVHVRGGCLDALPGPVPSNCCVFYGWVILAVSIGVKVVATAGTLRTIAFIVPSMLEDPEVDMKPSELSTLFSVGTFVGALGAPYLGTLVDTLGARTCIPMGMMGAALAFLTLARATSGPSLILGFLLVRMLCLGGLMQWAAVPVSHWFEAGRGRAQSYSIVGRTLITAILWFPFLERLIAATDWRFSLRCAACAMVVSAVPVAFLTYHDPESVGCQPDGGNSPPAKHKNSSVQDDDSDELEGGSPQPRLTASPSKLKASQTPQRSFTLREALKTRALLLLLASDSYLDFSRAPYVLYGVKYIDLVSLAPFSGGQACGPIYLTPYT